MQFDLFDPDKRNGPRRLPLQDAEVDYYANFITQTQATQLFVTLRQTLAWRQDSIKLYGKYHKIPRMQAWYGDAGSQYQYSNLTLEPLPWTSALSQLKEQCEDYCAHPFNAVLANLYRDGNDSMGWHADDEPELGTNPVIASISLGEARNFDFKHKTSAEKYRIKLEHGSLLIMSGSTQAFWQHGIAKTRVPLDERINLTFRYILDQKI